MRTFIFIYQEFKIDADNVDMNKYNIDPLSKTIFIANNWFILRLERQLRYQYHHNGGGNDIGNY